MAPSIPPARRAAGLLLAVAACAGPRAGPPPLPPPEPGDAPDQEVYLPEPAVREQAARPEDPRLRVLDRILPRSAWTRVRSGRGDLRALGTIRRITVHHSASPEPFLATDPAGVAAYLERVRRFHTGRRGWADIGYHFALDPAGRVWACRPLRWQGAHVRDFNEGNVGIVVLGNFEEQEPTLAQLLVLPLLVRDLRARYAVPLDAVRSHGEWPSSTACPGAALQRQWRRMRATGELGS